MKLYGFWRSTATWRVRIGLAYKGLDYEVQPIHLLKGGGEQHGEAYRALNPMEQVPLLELDEDGRVIRLTQSMAILEYLEERYPEPTILPGDRYARARARQLAEMVNAGIQPLQNTSVQLRIRDVIGADEKAWTRHWVSRGLAALEACTAATAGRFSVGDSVSLADLFLVPELNFARRFAVPLDGCPTLVRIDAACSALPAFQQAHADRQPDAER